MNDNLPRPTDRRCLPLYLILAFALSGLPTFAIARGTIRLDSCIVSFGSFCPLETVGAMIVVVVFMAAVSLALRLAWRWFCSW